MPASCSGTGGCTQFLLSSRPHALQLTDFQQDAAAKYRLSSESYVRIPCQLIMNDMWP